LIHLCLWAQTLLRLRCWNILPSDQYGGWRKPLAYLTLSRQKRHSASQEAYFATLDGGFGEAKTAENKMMRRSMSHTTRSYR